MSQFFEAPSSRSSLCVWFRGFGSGSVRVAVSWALPAHRALFTLGCVLTDGPVLFLPLQSFLHLCVVIQSFSHWVDNVLLQNE